MLQQHNFKLQKLIVILFKPFLHFFKMINLYEEQESLLDTIRGLIDSYNNDTEAIKDEFTVAVYLERLEHYHIQLLDRHT